MATTTNYSWSTPDDTALVKDGAAAIRTLGSSVDTTTKALNPSTTLGDIEYRSSTANTNTRLGIGTTGQVLTVSGGVPAWATATAPSTNWTLLNAGGTALTGAQTITVSGISAKDKIMILVTNASTSDAYGLGVRFNTDTGNNYYNYGVVWGRSNNNGLAQTPTNVVGLAYVASSSENGFGYLLLTGANASGVKVYQSLGGATDNASAAGYSWGGYYDSASTISSISIVSSSTNFDNGTVYVYTSA